MIELIAPAKLTTSLRIVGVRDDGYHLIDAEMVSLDLADVLTITDGAGVTYVGEHAPTAEFDNDLVARALALVGREAAVEVRKRIPAGGGLGGGSTDAAAVLRWANFDDLDSASRIGADVPFCIVGGRANVGGIGEVVEPLAFEHRTFTLALAPFGCDTSAVYGKWDELGGPTGSGGNDLEPAALEQEPRLEAWRDTLGDATGQTPQLAGSGSTWFVEGAYPGEGRVVVNTTPAQS